MAGSLTRDNRRDQELEPGEVPRAGRLEVDPQLLSASEIAVWSVFAHLGSLVDGGRPREHNGAHARLDRSHAQPCPDAFRGRAADSPEPGIVSRTPPVYHEKLGTWNSR